MLSIAAVLPRAAPPCCLYSTCSAFLCSLLQPPISQVKPHSNSKCKREWRHSAADRGGGGARRSATARRGGGALHSWYTHTQATGSTKVGLADGGAQAVVRLAARVHRAGGLDDHRDLGARGGGGGGGHTHTWQRCSAPEFPARAAPHRQVHIVRVHQASRDAREARKRSMHRVVGQHLAVDAVAADGGDGLRRAQRVGRVRGVKCGCAQQRRGVPSPAPRPSVHARRPVPSPAQCTTGQCTLCPRP